MNLIKSFLVLTIALLLMSFYPNPAQAKRNSWAPRFSTDFVAQMENWSDSIQNAQYRYVEDEIGKMELNCQNSDKLTGIYNILAKLPIPRLNDWCIKSSGSYIPFMIRGRAYKDKAWDARGSGWANTVTDEGSKIFQEYLLRAKQDLEMAKILNPKDPNSYAALITVMMGLQGDRKLMEEEFEMAIHLDPCNWAAHSAKLNFIMGKWYGSDDEMFKFAREVTSNAPKGSRVPFVLIEAHEQLFRREWDRGDTEYFKSPATWREVKEIYQNYLEVHPDSIRDRNCFASYAILSEHLDVAKEQFSILKNRFEGTCWRSIDSFNRSKKRAMSYGDKEH